MNRRRTTIPRRRAAPPVRGFASEWVARLARTTRFVDPDLMARWPSLAGDELAALCRPGRLTGGRRDRTLEVYVTNGAAATKIRFEESRLILRINEFLGPGVVGRIAIRQSGGASKSTANSATGGDETTAPSRENRNSIHGAATPETPTRPSPTSPGTEPTPKGLSRFRAPPPDKNDDPPF